jgi:hypothetical protein
MAVRRSIRSRCVIKGADLAAINVRLLGRTAKHRDLKSRLAAPSRRPRTDDCPGERIPAFIVEHAVRDVPKFRPRDIRR